MKFILAAGFIFLSIIGLKAQSDFRNGYIINNANDTVYGLIDYKGSIANAKKCIYRKDIDAENKVFTANEIKSYQFIDSKRYVSKFIPVGTETEPLFLEYLINGIVDIYYYRDNIGEHYLIDNGNGKLYELKNEEREIVRNNVRYFEKSNEYIGILKYIFRDSPLISKRVENVQLSHKSLIDIAHDYHNEVCQDEECIIYEKKLPKEKKIYGIVAGINGMSISEIRELAYELYYLKDNQFGFNIYPSIGMFYKQNMPFVNERLYFQYEGTYSFVNLKTTNVFIDPVYNMSYTNDIDLTLHVFNNLGIVKYEFPKGKYKPTFQIGGFVKYFFKSDYTRNLEIGYEWGDTEVSDESSENPFSNFDFGINCGFGLTGICLNDKELFVDLRYQRGFGFFRDFNTNTIMLCVGLQIGK